MSAATSASTAAEQARWKPKANPWLIALAVMMPMFMEILDSSIANVALNHIAGNLSATYSEATWVLTSYLIANAIVMPLTAWLGDWLERKRFLMMCILVFTVSSLLCGLSPNLPTLLFMRVIQGLGGGGLAPVGLAILMESFPAHLQGAAQALFGLGVVVAPTVGPILGGWLTDSYSWRWIFYINVPFGMLAMWAVQKTVEDPPWVREAKPGPMDAVGFIALSVWLGCQEVFLDKGQEKDWLSSGFICWMGVLAVAGFAIFVWRELNTDKPMVDLRVFRYGNFVVCTALTFVAYALIYGSSLAVPQFLQQLMGYTAAWAGKTTAALGLGAVLAMVLVGMIVQKVEPRWILFGGFLFLGFASMQISRLTLEIGPWTLFWPLTMAGTSMSLLTVPAIMAGTMGMRRDQLGSATGMINLTRNVGGSVGIAMVTTFLARSSQAHQNMLVQHLTPGNARLMESAHATQAYLAMKLPSSGNGAGAAMALMGKIVEQQSYLLAFCDVYVALGLIAIGSAGLSLFVARIHGRGTAVMMH